MADVAKKLGVTEQEQQDWRRIRITLTSRNVKNVEEGMIDWSMMITYYIG